MYELAFNGIWVIVNWSAQHYIKNFGHVRGRNIVDIGLMHDTDQYGVL